ncbi:PAS domain S-box protein [Nocardioides pakistanensis]
MRRGHGRLFADAAVLAALGTSAFLLADRFDVSDRISAWAARHGGWPVGDLVLAIGVLVVGTFGLIWRRSHELAEEMRAEAHTQRLLDESLQRYRSLFDHNTDLVLSLDLDGRTTSVNPAAERITGYPVEELMAVGWAEVIAPESRDDVAGALTAALHGEVRELTLTMIRKDRERVRLHATSSPIVVDGEVVGIYGIAKDITEAEDLQRRLAFLSYAVDSATEAIAVHDIEGRLIYANKTLAEMSGWESPTDLVGEHWHSCYDPEEAARLCAVSEPALRETGHWTGMTTARDVDGRTVHRELSLTVLGGTHILSINRDVTERERALEALRQSEERYQLATRATQEVMWDADLRTGRTIWSGAIGPLLGLEGETLEFHSRWWDDRLHPDDREATLAGLVAALASDRSSWHGEYRLMRADGEYATVFARGHVARDEDGNPFRVVGSMMDITERTRREEELRQARLEAEEANQAKSLFLANMSHEIRTPMNGVIGMVDLLLETDLDPEQRRYAETVRQSGDRLLVIINDILDLSKVEAGQLRLEEVDFEMRGVVQGVVMPMAAHAQRQGLTFTTVGCTGNRVFRGDPDRVAQVLTNLISNAVKFTEQGGVELRVGGAEQDEGPGATITFEVQDTGIGLTEQQIGRLFRPFSQADASTTRRYGGTGLGLAISRQLVEAMGGEISVQSRPGEGSMFRVELSLPPGDPAAVVPPSTESGNSEAERPTSATRRSGHGLTVLLVEDNPVNQDVARLMLTRLGYAVDVAEDGIAALEVLAARTYAAVLMDVQMPNMDGYETTRRLRERETASGLGTAARVPIIAMTANALAGDRDKALAAGMDDYLAKPVKLDELEAVLSRWATDGAPGELPPAAREGFDSEPLDPETVATLRTIALGSGDGFLDRLVSTFVHDTEAQLTALDTAVTVGDATAVGEISHSLRSSSASMGAVVLAGLFERLETSAADGLTAAPAVAAGIRRELERVRAALRTQLAPTRL